MKNVNLFLLISLFIIVQSVTAFSQVLDWVYPIKPGSEEWMNILKSEGLGGIDAKLRIPEDVLQKMTTRQLFKAWMDYPMRSLINAFNTYQAGFEAQIKRSNALKVLLEREDAGKAIFQEYKLLLSGTDTTKGIITNVKDISYVELLISQEKILNKLSKNEKTDLLKFSLDNEQKRKEYRKGSLLAIGGILLEGRVLINLDDKEFKEIISKDRTVESYFQNVEMLSISKETENKINDIAKKYVKIK